MRIDAVVFDLDDTLFPQAEWLDGAWQRVAGTASVYGVDPGSLVETLRAVASEGSGRGRIIDRSLERIGATHVPVEPLVEAFRTHEAAVEPYPGVTRALQALRVRVPIGLVTDGDPSIQRAKLRSLRLNDAFDAVVLSDTLGRHRRKPHPDPFRAVLDALGAPAAACVFVGDRPDKDVAGALAAGMRPVRVYTGEFASAPDRPRPWATAPDAVKAIERLLRLLGARSQRKTGTDRDSATTSWPAVIVV